MLGVLVVSFGVESENSNSYIIFRVKNHCPAQFQRGSLAGNVLHDNSEPKRVRCVSVPWNKHWQSVILSWRGVQPECLKLDSFCIYALGSERTSCALKTAVNWFWNRYVLWEVMLIWLIKCFCCTSGWTLLTNLLWSTVWRFPIEQVRTNSMFWTVTPSDGYQSTCRGQVCMYTTYLKTSHRRRSTKGRELCASSFLFGPLCVQHGIDTNAGAFVWERQAKTFLIMLGYTDMPFALVHPKGTGWMRRLCVLWMWSFTKVLVCVDFLIPTTKTVVIFHWITSTGVLCLHFIVSQNIAVLHEGRFSLSSWEFTGNFLCNTSFCTAGERKRQHSSCFA